MPILFLSPHTHAQHYTNQTGCDCVRDDLLTVDACITFCTCTTHYYTLSVYNRCEIIIFSICCNSAMHWRNKTFPHYIKLRGTSYSWVLDIPGLGQANQNATDLRKALGAHAEEYRLGTAPSRISWSSRGFVI